MIKTIFKTVFYFFVFLIFVVALLPKENLYYELEKQLLKQDIIISNESLDNKFLGFNIKASDIYVKDIFAANINKIDLKTFLLFNKIDFSGIRFSKGFSNIAPTPIDNISITYSVVDIFKAKIDGNSIYGKITGYIDFRSKKILIGLKANNQMKNKYSKILREMKLKDGVYVYEYNY